MKVYVYVLDIYKKSVLQERIEKNILMFSGCSEVLFDFEDGASSLEDWGRTGTAFDNQPTYQDNVQKRGRGQISNHQGDYWIGTAENRPYPSSPAGSVVGDGPQGFIISPEFLITGLIINFMFCVNISSTLFFVICSIFYYIFKTYSYNLQ